MARTRKQQQPKIEHPAGPYRVQMCELTEADAVVNDGWDYYREQGYTVIYFIESDTIPCNYIPSPSFDEIQADVDELNRAWAAAQ